MRAIPEELAARLVTGVTTLAHICRIQRRDGSVFAFTDHDRALVFDGVACEPSAGLSIGAIEKSLGLGVDTCSLSGALQSDTITDTDLAAGAWDGARIDLYRVDWTAPDLSVHLFAGRFGEARRGVSAFEIELRGLQAPLNTSVGRVFSRFCDADVGDARCGVALDEAAFTGEGAIVEVLSATTFRASGLEAFADGWFTGGRVSWAGGGLSEAASHRADAEGAMIEIAAAPGVPLIVGAGFTISAGCDKRFETCRAKFANTVNFRAFPHMPGNDAMQAGPLASDLLDGSSRFS